MTLKNFFMFSLRRMKHQCMPLSQNYPTYRDNLVKEDDIIVTFPSDILPCINFNKIPSRDETLMSNVCPSLKICTTLEDTLVEKYDITRNASIDV